MKNISRLLTYVQRNPCQFQQQILESKHPDCMLAAGSPPFKDDALFWHSVWISVGRSLNTEQHRIMRRTKYTLIIQDQVLSLPKACYNESYV